MAVQFETALELVFGKLQKAVEGQIIQSARFKTLLTRLENTLKCIEPVFYESSKLTKVLDRSEKDTMVFISYLENRKEIVLKCSSINWTAYTRFLHSKKLIRLNNELLRFFQIQFQKKKMGIFDLEEKIDSSVTIPDGECLIISSVCLYPDLPFMGNFANLRRIRFEGISVSPSIQIVFTLQNLQKLSFVMCEIGDALMINCTTEYSAYMLPNLTDFEIDSCYDLKELPSEVCNAVHLQNLRITNCHELGVLPNALGNLLNLEILDLHCCTKLEELPESIGNLHNLSFLDLSDCLNISLLPEEIGELSGLRVLKMSGVHGLQELPESMSKLSLLEDVICDEETSYLWMNFESDLENLKINVVEEDRFESLMKIIQ